MAFLPSLISPTGSVLVQPDPNSASVDAFQRQRTSEPYTLFDAQFHRDKLPIVFDETTAGGASAAVYNANANAVDMTLGTAAGESIVRQTYEWYRYQSGKSQLILLTGVLGEPKNNVRKRAGYFNANNGIFVESNSTQKAFVIRTSTSGAPVDTVIPQASWNLDRLDGTGPSGLTLDLDSTNILAMDFEWLGVGAVRFAFVIDGVFVVAHKEGHANVGLTVPYMQTGSLPVRYEITNTGVAASGTTLRQICHTVASEAGFNPRGIIRSTPVAVAGRAVSVGSFAPQIAIRMKSADARNTVTPLAYNFTASAAQEYALQLRFRPATYTAGSFVDIGANSIVEYDVTGTAATGGTIIWSSTASRDSSQQISLSSALVLGSSIAGTADILVLEAAQRVGGAATAYSSILFQELF